MLRVALFGAGRIGDVHARSIADNPDADLAWICDPVEAAATALAERHGGRPSGDPGEALADVSVDAVVIASATPTHIDLIRRSVDAGKKILCEKPIDMDLEAIDRCWADVRDREPFIMLGFNRRFDASFREVRERVAAGEIGPIRTLRLTSRDPHPPPPAYLATSGGMFRDMTIHDFDMAGFFLGDIVEVSATATTNADPLFEEAHDHAQAIVTLRAASGALGTIVNSRTCAFGYDQRLEAFGDLGSLEVTNQTATSVRASDGMRTGAADRFVDFFLERYASAYRAELAEFLSAIRAGRPPVVGFADGRRAQALAEAAIESVATGRTVQPRPAA